MWLVSSLTCVATNVAFKVGYGFFRVVEVGHRNPIVILAIEAEPADTIFRDGRRGATISMYAFVNYAVDFPSWDTIVVSGNMSRRRDGATIWIGGWPGLEHGNWQHTMDPPSVWQLKFIRETANTKLDDKWSSVLLLQFRIEMQKLVRRVVVCGNAVTAMKSDEHLVPRRK